MSNNIRPGDLLIWNKRQPCFPYGHVAVVLNLQLGGEQPFITLCEENYDDIWDSNQQARKLKVSLSNFGLVQIINKKEVAGCDHKKSASITMAAQMMLLLDWQDQTFDDYDFIIQL